MQVVVIGVNQHSAPVVLREHLAFDPKALPEPLRQLGQVVQEGFILSTCNRVELYGLAGHADTGAEALLRFLALERGLSLETLRHHSYRYAHEGAARHLYRVAAGLDSMVPGEDQILGQVKSALEAAREAGMLGPALHRLGQTALAVGKRVRAETGISRSPLSVVSLGIGAAIEALGDLASRRILILGAGKTAELALKHLKAVSPDRVTVINRTTERASALARIYGAGSAPWSDMARELSRADLLLSCTAAPARIISLAAMAAAREDVCAPLLCVDLGVPRNIDPEVTQLPGVSLYDMDRLNALSAGNRVERMAELARAEAIVDQGSARFIEWWHARRAAPAIARLRAHAEAIRDAELERARARLGPMTPREALIIRGMASRIVNRLLHQPITALKSNPDGDTLAQALTQLFGFAGDEPPVAPPASQPPITASPAHFMADD